MVRWRGEGIDSEGSQGRRGSRRRQGGTGRRHHVLGQELCEYRDGRDETARGLWDTMDPRGERGEMNGEPFLGKPSS